jgi:hypothetical protein
MAGDITQYMAASLASIHRVDEVCWTLKKPFENPSVYYDETLFLDAVRQSHIECHYTV